MEYRDLLRQWPVGPEGQPEPPALLTVADDSPGGRDLCRSLLASFGIPILPPAPARERPRLSTPAAHPPASASTSRSPA